jgi:hypothetical protein
MAKKNADPLQYFNIKTDENFPEHLLLIVDTEKRELTLLNAKTMEIWKAHCKEISTRQN